MTHKLIELYINKFINGEIDYHGLILSCEIQSHSNKPFMMWTVQNPKDLPYSRAIVQETIVDSLSEFLKSSGLSDWNWNIDYRKILTYFILDSAIPSHYFPDWFRQELNDVVKRTHTFTLPNYDFTMKYKIKNWHLAFDSDELRASSDIVYFNPMSLKYNEPLLDTQATETLEKCMREDSHEIEIRLITPLLDVVWECPTLYDNRYMYTSPGIDIRNTKGQLLDI